MYAKLKTWFLSNFSQAIRRQRNKRKRNSMYNLKSVQSILSGLEKINREVCEKCNKITIRQCMWFTYKTSVFTTTYKMYETDYRIMFCEANRPIIYSVTMAWILWELGRFFLSDLFHIMLLLSVITVHFLYIFWLLLLILYVLCCILQVVVILFITSHLLQKKCFQPMMF